MGLGRRSAGRLTTDRIAFSNGLVRPGALVIPCCEIGGRKLALLGDMRELGPRSAELHAGLAQPVLAANLDALMTVEEQMTHPRRVLPKRILGPHYATADDVLPDLVRILRAGDQLLVKASHGTRLYEVVARMRLGNGGGVAA